MTTRDLFRGAAKWVQEHPILDLAARPAFIYRPGEVEALPQVEEPPRQSAKLSTAMPTVVGTARAVREGRLTAREAVMSSLERIAALNGKLHAFTTVREREALEEGEVLDAELSTGKLRGLLHGVPVSVKDVIHVAGIPTTASSRVLDGFIPSEDASAVRRLKAAGAIVIGKTETHEFALGVTTPQSRNPWDPRRIPGGSTGGSAIAVATGMTPGGLGTDTRASIRVPAALSGVVGFKPTFGLVPTHGVVTLSWSMDHVAPMAATVEDTALLLDVIAGRDVRDPNSVERPAASYLSYIGANISRLRIGAPAAAFDGADPGVAAAVQAALNGLRGAGCTLCDLDEPSRGDLEMTNAAGMIVSRAEAASFHYRWLAEQPKRYTAETFAQLDEASRVPAVVYLAAQRLREEFRQRMLSLFHRVDVLALPTTLVQAPLVEEAEQYLLVLSRNCIPWSFVGFPAVSLPCGRTTDGLPIGLQLVGPPFQDGRLISLGTAVESLGLWNADLPPNSL